MDREEIERAVELRTQALALPLRESEGRLAARRERARAYLNLGQFDLAMCDVDYLISQKAAPTGILALARIHRGEVVRKTGRPGEAILEFETVLNDCARSDGLKNCAKERLKKLQLARGMKGSSSRFCVAGSRTICPVALLLASAIITCARAARGLAAEQAHPIGTFIAKGSDAAWSQLTNEVQKAKPALLDENWLETSNEIYGNSSHFRLMDLVVLWRNRDSRQGWSQFMNLRLAAFVHAAERLVYLEDYPDVLEAHRPLPHFFSDFPDSHWSGEYLHERHAQFSLLAALFSHCAVSAKLPERAGSTDWLYLHGRALQAINIGGREQLRAFAEKTKGRSPYARLALRALTKSLREEISSRNSAGNPHPPPDLFAMTEKAERVQAAKVSSKLPREAWGLHATGELQVEVVKTDRGATLTVYDWKGGMLSRRAFAEEEFEAVGGYSGLWVPAVQPMRNAFMINKFGAYAGRTLLVRRDGRLLEFPGGMYHCDPAANRLFLREDTDIDGLTTVLEMNEIGRIVCASVRPEDLRDTEGKRIRSPSEFVCLPELASEKPE